MADHTGKTEKVWVVRKNGKIHVSPIADVASERDFYSRPSADGATTLDDEITRYEGHLAKLVASLRALPIGSQADAETASEILAHLAPRAASIRDLLQHGIEGFVASASPLLTNAENVFHLLGLDVVEPDDRFRENFKDAIARILTGIQLDVPPVLIERLAFALVQEGFSDLFSQHMAQIGAAMAQLGAVADQGIKDSHNSALRHSLVMEVRQQDLRAFSWSIVVGPTDGALLPDCVAVASKSNSKFTPYIMTDRTDITSVVMPLSTDKLLVGRKAGASWPDLKNYNEDAAACSSAFVVCAKTPPNAEHLCALIGTRSTQAIDELVSAAVQDNLTAKLVDLASASELSGNERPRVETSAFTYQISFIDCADESTAARITEIVRDVVERYSHISPLHRLDGITFAADYLAALKNLDRGLQTKEEAIAEDAALSYVEAILIVRNGTIKVRIIARGELAQALIDEDSNVAEFGLHAVIYALAKASYYGQLDSTLPGLLLTQTPDEFDGVLIRSVDPAIAGYFAARGSAGFGADQHCEMNLRESLLQSFDRLENEIRASKESYLQHQNVDPIYLAGLRAAAQILGLVANLLGHRAGLGLPIFTENDPLEKLMRTQKLRVWIELFDRELGLLWSRRGEWTSADEILLLKRHTERLLWTFGIFPWRVPTGQTYVRFVPSQPV